MGLIRLLLLVAIVWLAYHLYRRWKLGRATPPSAPRAASDMVRCRHCGLFLPREQALRDGDHYYCSQAHRQADRG